jgi:hypothetical protein
MMWRAPAGDGRHWVQGAFVGFAAVLCGCSTLPAGRGYTMAKANYDGRLVEARERLLNVPAIQEAAKGVDTTNDLDRIAPNKTIGIRLTAGYIRYLESIKRANVAIFTRTLVRKSGEASNGLVWESVFTPNKDEKVQTVVNKDTTLPFQDVDILPPIDYSDQDIAVELRVVSLKQEDNARIGTLINAAAAGAAFAKPEAAAAISVFQAVLTFLIENRPDVVEFAFNFKITPEELAQRAAGPPRAVGALAPAEISLAPRVATYAVIKTEHEARLNYPSEYIGFASDGIRYALAQVVKLGTLGIANWPLWHGARQEDVYLMLFGRPFSVERASWQLPEWKGGTLHTSADQWRDVPVPTQTTATPVTLGEEIHLVNGNLAICDGERCVPYREQSYVTISVVSPFAAIPFDAIKGAADQQKAIDDLGIRTGWKSAADLKKSLEGVTNSLKGFYAERDLRERCQTALAKAKTKADVDAASKSGGACEDGLDAAKGSLTSETQGAFEQSFKRWIADAAKRRRKQVPDADAGDTDGSGTGSPTTPGIE